MSRFLLSFCLCLTMLGSQAIAKPANNQHVVLISVDGLRHDYIEKYQAEALTDIAARGVRAERLVPVYPANTFPNHLSIITGRYPVNHGVVNNRFADKTRPQASGYAHYTMGKGRDDSSWLQGMPLWNLAEVNGVKAATYFWPESDARINGRTPTYYYHYSKYADYQARVDQIINWLRLSKEARPRFIAGYFSLVDSQGHNFGPTATQTKNAVEQMDRLLGQLYQRLQTFDFPVNLIIVSDHGMQKTEASNKILLETLSIDPALFEVVNQHTQIHIYARKETELQQIADLENRLTSHAHPHYQVMNSALRNKYHYPVTATTGDIVVQAQPGVIFADSDQSDIKPGAHGYWPEAPAMGATFVAAGPAFKKNTRLPPMSNLEIYPAVAHIMGLPLPVDVDGKLDVIRQGLN